MKNKNFHLKNLMNYIRTINFLEPHLFLLLTRSNGNIQNISITRIFHKQRHGRIKCEDNQFLRLCISNKGV